MGMDHCLILKKKDLFTCETGAAKEEREAALCFWPLVPHSNQIQWAREHACLRHAQEKSGCQEPTIICNKPLADCDESKKKRASRKPNMRFEFLQKYVGGDLEQDIGHKEDGQRIIVLISLQSQVFLKPKNGRIGDVCAIEEGKQVEDTQDGDDSEIDPWD